MREETFEKRRAGMEDAFMQYAVFPKSSLPFLVTPRVLGENLKEERASAGAWKVFRWKKKVGGE